MKRRLQQAALFVGSLALFLSIAELALRFWLPVGFYVWPPTSARGSRSASTR